jgi:LysR family transcriptional regulator, nitrogen assimilation regulatory protein
MDLRQLRTFLQVAELGSLSKAADRSRIAQPALGRQIKMLEDEFGVLLFTRHGRGMVPTSGGQILIERAAAILRLVDDTRAEISARRDAVTGSVSLGLPPTVGDVLAAPLVVRFLKQYPSVTVRIVPAFSGFLLDMLQRGEIDQAITYQTTVTRQIKAEPLILETLFLIGPPTSKLRTGRPVDLKMLAKLPMILPGPRQGLRTLVEEAAQRASIELKVSVEAESLQTLKQLVGKGLGYTVLPFAAVHAEVQAGALRAAPIMRPALTRQLVLSRSFVRPATNAVRRFSEELKALTTELVRDGIWRGELLFAHGPRVSCHTRR